MRFSRFAPILLISLQACSPPETQPLLTEKTKDADRLSTDLRSFMPPLQLVMEGDSGAMQARLRVRPDGTVADAQKLGGSNQLWFNLRSPIYALRFKATDPADKGPWDVVMSFVSKSSGGGSLMEAMGTGSSSSSSSFKMEILDVKTAPHGAN